MRTPGIFRHITPMQILLRLPHGHRFYWLHGSANLSAVMPPPNQNRRRHLDVEQSRGSWCWAKPPKRAPSSWATTRRSLIRRTTRRRKLRILRTSSRPVKAVLFNPTDANGCGQCAQGERKPACRCSALIAKSIPPTPPRRRCCLGQLLRLRGAGATLRQGCRQGRQVCGVARPSSVTTTPGTARKVFTAWWIVSRLEDGGATDRGL